MHLLEPQYPHLAAIEHDAIVAVKLGQRPFGFVTLRILGENDRANEEAVELCGRRWQAADRNVRVIKPTRDCKDLNDILGSAP